MASSDGPLSAATELLLSPVVTPALRARAGGPGIAVDDSLRAARQCAAAASSVAGALAAPNSSGYCSKPSASARFHPQGDCRVDDSGVFEAAAGEACLSRCRACERCRFVSLEPAGGARCHWYSESRELRDYLRLLEALPNFAAPSKLSKNCSRYTVAGSAAGGGACNYPDVVRQVLL